MDVWHHNSMNSAELLSMLNELKADRRMPTEIKAIIDPLRSQKYSIELIFVSATRTFGNRFDSSYDNGYTALCRIAEGDFEVSMMFPAVENETIAAREPGDVFDAQVALLDFDGLYQRAVLGHSIEDVVPLAAEHPEEKTEAPQTKEMTEQLRNEQNEPAEKEDYRPKEFVEKKWGGNEGRLSAAQRSFKSETQGDLDSHQTDPSKKWMNVGLAGAGVLSVFFVTASWDTLITGDEEGYEWNMLSQPANWAVWAFLTYVIGLGLPCLANQSRLLFYMALVAFALDLGGTYMEYHDIQEQSYSFFIAAMALQAITLLGLSFSLALKNRGFWPLATAFLFAAYTYQQTNYDAQFGYFEFVETIASKVNPSLPFLVAISFCCWSIIKHELNPNLDKA